MSTLTLKETSCSTGPKGSGSAMFKYELVTDTVILSPMTALAIGRSLGVPQHGAVLDDAYLFALNFDANRNKANRNNWDIDVQFSPPPDGEDDEQQSESPLNRSAVYDIQYIEQEYVISRARNLEDIGGDVWGVPSGTLGPITNGALHRPDEPLVDTTRNPVVVIEKNYPSLGAIMELNEAFLLTTNSDNCNVDGRSIAPRRLKFLAASSLGRQQEGDVVYYPCRIEIELKKTTDLEVDNVGYEYWDPAENAYVRATDKYGEFTGDPVYLQAMARGANSRPASLGGIWNRRRTPDSLAWRSDET